MDGKDITQAVIDALLTRMIEDQQLGDLPPVEHYLALFPGYEDVVAREYRALTPGGISGHAPSEESIPRDIEERIGPFEVVRELGRGAQACVFEARDTRFCERRVALKVFDRGLQGTVSDFLRFRREAEVLGRLQAPGLPAIHDVDLAAERPWIALEYVSDRTLALDLAETRGTQDSGRSTATRARIERVVRLVEQIARALHVAHGGGIVHRDIKPSNILIATDGRPFLVDFGLARDVRDTPSQLTLTREDLCTPAYMAPEVLEGARADARADVWSLGVVLYEALTLALPFQAPTREGLFRAILEAPCPSLRKRIPAAGRELEVVTATALERDGRRRYQSAWEFAEDLRRILDHEPIQARPAGPWLRLRRWIRRRPGLAASSALAITLLASANLMWWQRAELRHSERAAVLDTGTSRLEAWRWQEALEAFDRALLYDDVDSPAAATGRIAALAGLGRMDEARDYLQRTIKRDGGDDAMRDRRRLIVGDWRVLDLKAPRHEADAAILQSLTASTLAEAITPLIQAQSQRPNDRMIELLLFSLLLFDGERRDELRWHTLRIAGPGVRDPGLRLASAIVARLDGNSTAVRALIQSGFGDRLPVEALTGLDDLLTLLLEETSPLRLTLRGGKAIQAAEWATLAHLLGRLEPLFELYGPMMRGAPLPLHPVLARWGDLVTSAGSPEAVARALAAQDEPILRYLTTVSLIEHAAPENRRFSDASDLLLSSDRSSMIAGGRTQGIEEAMLYRGLRIANHLRIQGGPSDGRDRNLVQGLLALPRPSPDLLGVVYNTARDHLVDWALCERISAKALLLYPDLQDTRLRTAVTAYYRGHYHRALREARTALQHDPKDEVAASIFERSLERLDRFGEGDDATPLDDDVRRQIEASRKR
jgi:serine/threonine protein kinase